jgi:hypothetical protein
MRGKASIQSINLFSPTGQVFERNADPQTIVAAPGCLSRIPNPDFCPSRIQKQQQKRGVKKHFLSYLFFSHKYQKI